MTLNKNLFLIIPLALCMLASGCSSKNSDFYILSAAKFSNIQQHHGCRNNILVERVKLPGYIDKPEIVTRISQNQINQAEFHRWAASLSGNISDVIAQNLSQQLTQDRILTYPRLSTSNINYYLILNVNQFDVDCRGQSILKVTWSIYNQNRKLIITRNPSYIFYARDPKNYEDITNAMNRNITALSSDLAFHLKRLGCNRAPSTITIPETQ